MTVNRIEAKLIGPDGVRIPSANIDIHQAKYVPIIEPSRSDYLRSSRFDYKGLLPDPLVAFSPVTLKAGDDNLLIWIDIHVPSNVPPGQYNGEVRLITSDLPIVVPVSLTVWDFTLPDRSTCRTSFRFTRYANLFLFPYHKTETKEDRYALSRAYIETMAKYRITPTGPMSAGVWHPDNNGRGSTPQEAINTYKTEADWAFNKLHFNATVIGHVSGPSLEQVTPQIVQKHVDRYLPGIKWMKKNGYLKWCTLLIDEPRPVTYRGVRQLIKAFRADEVGREVPTFAYVYNAPSYYDLHDIIDILTPINNDATGVVSPVGIKKRQLDNKETWFYYTRTAHLWIDSPGINHRLWAPSVQAFGGTGLAIWAINMWWNNPTVAKNHIQYNPWENPHTTWGNGSLAYFYPPNRLGKALPEKDMSIVPSLRMLLTRDGIEDFEYVVILKKLITQAKQQNINTTDADAAIAATQRPFITPRSWSLGETYWMQTRAAVASAIVRLQAQLH
ncbi:DUF4091 domain-containing protein [bacterium AH-315-I18]|nr:DUF4091 domain-containing protein [bacterium AH-315-I18]